jgi:cytochrome c oxidase cbb3-type subunit 3
VTGDLQGFAARAADPRDLQNRWVSGGAAGRGGRGAAPDPAVAAKPVTATITPSNGAPIEGRLLRMDDFFVTVQLADGTRRTIRRNGDDPKVDVHDPMDAHHKFASTLSDKDMHDVTAYLWSLR